jgi:hypothetical protein
MSEQLVRGYWLTGGIKFLRTHYAPEVNERLLGSLSKGLRSQLADIQPVRWYPRAHHVDIMSSIVSAHRDETSAYQSLLAYGQLVATDIAHGSFYSLMQILTTKLLAKKLPDFWVADHQSDGTLEADIAQVDEGRLALRLADLHGYQHVGVVALGWVKGLLVSLGHRDVQVKQTGWSLGQTTPSEIACEVRWS